MQRWLLAVPLFLTPALALAAGIVLGQAGKTGVTATITPDSSEIGSTTNVYFAATLGGKVYFRHQSSQDWRVYSGGAYPVAISGQALQSSTAVTVTDLDVTALSGLEIYVAYGNSEAELAQKAGHLSKIYSNVTSTSTTKFKGEAWADNWFALYVGDKLVAEDSVPITTERSFNAETFYFDATYPFDLNFIVKDYKENDSGLEYIGTTRQQMGDGGFIAQITDTTTGKVVAVSSSSWRCKVIHKAPLNKTCEKDSSPLTTCLSTIEAEPTGWKNTGYNTSGWETPAVYTETQVGAKEGYYNITWNSAAKLIWTSDLQADNTLLCKATVSAP